MVVCRVAHRLSHSSPCDRVHTLGCLSRDDEITCHPSGIRLSVVVGSGIIIRFACPVSLQVLARYLTSQSALALTSLALSLSVGDQKVERRLAAWALYFLEAGVLDAACGFYFHVRRYSKKIHCFVRLNSFHASLAKRRPPEDRGSVGGQSVRQLTLRIVGCLDSLVAASDARPY